MKYRAVALFFAVLVAFVLPSPASAAPLRALVILANFPDAVSSVPAAEYRRFFNDPNYSGANASMSVRSYVLAASGGRTDLEFTVTDWITLPRTAGEYEALDGGSINDGPIAMVRDAVALLASRGFDFRPFDNDRDGRLDLLGMVHRGSDPAFGTGTAPTWSTVPAIMPAIEIDGLRIERAWMITESDPAFGTMTTLGGVLHEMVGHGICGLPDLYGWLAGSWGPMYGGNAFRPTLFDAFSRQACGWSRVIDVETPKSVQLMPVEEGGEVYRLWVDPFREHEYFLLEYRKQSGLDRELPGSGLLIWHVDLAADQSSFLRLEQADGRDDLSNTFGFGAADTGDPYPGSTGNTAFTPDTIPGSNSRLGAPTNVRVENIGFDPATGGMTASIHPAERLRGITLAHDRSYPGFAWNWAPAAGNVQGERTAVRFISPVNGNLTAIKIKYWGPPLADNGLGFDLKVHGDFLASNILPPEVRAAAAGNLSFFEPENDWYAIALDEPLPVKAGETFIVDVGWTSPMIAVDFQDQADGTSYYRPPDAEGYTPLPYDLRIRALLETTEYKSPPIATYKEGILTIPRVSIPGLLVDAVAVQLRPAVDGLWDIIGLAADRYVLADAGATFSNSILSIPRATVYLTDTPINVADAQFRLNSDGRFVLISVRQE